MFLCVCSCVCVFTGMEVWREGKSRTHWRRSSRRSTAASSLDTAPRRTQTLRTEGHLWTHAHFLLPCVQWRAFTSRCQPPTAQQMCVWKGRFIFTFLHGTMKTTDVWRLFLFYNGFKYVVMSMWVQTSVTSQNPLMKWIQNNCEYKCEYKPLNTNTIITFQHH